jgi:hypothetical protein
MTSEDIINENLLFKLLNREKQIKILLLEIKNLRNGEELRKQAVLNAQNESYIKELEENLDQYRLNHKKAKSKIGMNII